MGDDVPQQDRLALVVGHLGAGGQPGSQGVVQRTLALGDQLRQQRSGHGLADRTDLERGIGADTRGVRVARALVRPRDPLRFDHRHRHAGAGAVAVQALPDHAGQLRIAHGPGWHWQGGEGRRDGDGE